MPAIKIPEQYVAGLKKLALLEEKSFQELYSALQEIPPKIYRKDVSARVKPLIKSISPEDIPEIANALFGVHLGRFQSNVSTDQFATDIAQMLSEQDTRAPKLTEPQRKSLQDRLTKLLAVNSLVVGAKAHSILFEHERNLTRTRILTDIRPVFGEKVADLPTATIIIHTLKISYMQGGEIKDFFVAMDTKDLSQLIDVLERAKQKNKSLKESLAKANLSCIEPE